MGLPCPTARHAGCGRRRVAFLLCVGIGLGGLACRGRAGPASLEVDLADLFRFTDAGQQTATLDLGAADAAPLLGEGWSAPSALTSGETVIRPVARKAVVQVTFVAPAQRTLIVRCGAAGAANAVARSVTVRLNGRRIGALRAGDELGDYRIALAAAAQRPGRNELAFSARLGRGPGRGGIAYDRLTIVDGAGPPQPAARREGDDLLLPSRSNVEYFLRVPSAAVLRFGLAGNGRLHVATQADGAAPRVLFDGRPPQVEQRLGIDEPAGTLVRISLRTAATAGEVRVRHPSLSGTAVDGAALAAAPSAATRWNVLLYVVDTLRADHMSLYGYARPTTPRLDGFAAAAAVFEDTVAQSSWTRPSTASIHTGRYPPAHGAMSLRAGIRPEIPTLAELLQRAGYRTGAIVTNINVAGQWGFKRGFEGYRYLPEDEHSSHVHVRADAVTEAALQWLAAADPAQPFFLYLHVSDPHAPYDPPAPFAGRFAAGDPEVSAGALLADLKRGGRPPTAAELATLVDRYDGEIAFVDAQFGRLLDELARRGMADRTLIVFTADHGEEFGEHGGLEHGRTLYQDQLHVPLVIRVPGGPGGRRIAARARQVDVLPTVAAAVGLGVPGDVDGRPLLPLRDGQTPGAPVEAMAQTSLGRRQLAAMLIGTWKVIASKEIGTALTEVYNLGVDPAEREDRSGGRQVLIGYVRQSLARADAAPDGGVAPPASPSSVDPAVLERLRALGYAD